MVVVMIIVIYVQTGSPLSPSRSTHTDCPIATWILSLKTIYTHMRPLEWSQLYLKPRVASTLNRGETLIMVCVCLFFVSTFT